MKKAHDEIAKIMKIRLRHRDILIAHDIIKFRSFMEEHRDMCPDDAAKIATLDDDGVSAYMHAMKCTMPFIGEEFQKSRNFFREKQLRQDLPHSKNELLHVYIGATNKLPICNDCEYLRMPPPGEKLGCMHLIATAECPNQRPATPADIACRAWQPRAKT